MSRWTGVRKIADQHAWYSDCFDHDGPACYELILAGPRGGSLRIVYVGETGNERTRLTCYARNGSHLSKLIDWHLARGWTLYYRAQATVSKNAAKRMQDNRLARYFYPWNRAGA
jgi:hypothetical protein